MYVSCNGAPTKREDECRAWNRIEGLGGGVGGVDWVVVRGKCMLSGGRRVVGGGWVGVWGVGGCPRHSIQLTVDGLCLGGR